MSVSGLSMPKTFSRKCFSTSSAVASSRPVGFSLFSPLMGLFAPLQHACWSFLFVCRVWLAIQLPP